MPWTRALETTTSVAGKRGLFCALVACFFALLLSGAAYAGSDDYKYEYKDGGCKYKYHENKHGYKEEYKCKGHYHKKYKHKYETRYQDCKYKYEESEKGYKEEYKCKHARLVQADGRYWPKHHKTGSKVLTGAPFGIDLGDCNRQLLGGLLGGAAGGVVGSQIGDGQGQLAATAAGTLLGAILGSEIGRNLDEVDRACAGQALEHAPDNKTVRWENPTRDTRYEVTPSRTYDDDDGRYCREYQTTGEVGGQRQQACGRACRQPDGSWEIIS